MSGSRQQRTKANLMIVSPSLGGQTISDMDGPYVIVPFQRTMPFVLRPRNISASLKRNRAQWPRLCWLPALRSHRLRLPSWPCLPAVSSCLEASPQLRRRNSASADSLAAWGCFPPLFSPFLFFSVPFPCFSFPSCRTISEFLLSISLSLFLSWSPCAPVSRSFSRPIPHPDKKFQKPSELTRPCPPPVYPHP